MGNPHTEDLRIHAKGRKMGIIILHDEDKKPIWVFPPFFWKSLSI